MSRQYALFVFVISHILLIPLWKDFRLAAAFKRSSSKRSKTPLRSMYVGRKHAIAVASGTLGLLLALKGYTKSTGANPSR